MSDEIPRRILGRTGVQVSALGVGGHHLGDANTVDDAIAIVHEAIDAGINFFDNCLGILVVALGRMAGPRLEG